jgi:hypothetical protein
MELNFSEMNPNLDNKFNYNDFNFNKDIKNEVVDKKVTFSEYNNYWDPKPEYEKAEPKKPSVSYDDILNSMNMVSINGRLHFIPTSKLQNTQNNINTKTTPLSKQTNYINNIHQQINNNQNSYIYNKYFQNNKNEQEPFQNDIPTVSLTPDEIKRRLIIHRLKQIQERKRIEQIKSKKLLFDTSNIHISNQSNNPPNLNKLFRFSDR